MNKKHLLIIGAVAVVAFLYWRSKQKAAAILSTATTVTTTNPNPPGTQGQTTHPVVPTTGTGNPTTVTGDPIP